MPTAPSAQHASFAPARLYGAVEGQDARLLADLARVHARSQKILIHVTRDENRAHHLLDFLSYFAGDVACVHLPSWDCLPYDRVSPQPDISAARLDALATLLSWQNDNLYKPRIFILSVNALSQFVVPREVVEQHVLTLKPKAILASEVIQKFLITNGYHRTETVREAGEFAVRGGILDIFPAGAEMPLRCDFFGDEIESLKSFDPATQLTVTKIDSFVLRAAREYFLDENSIARFRARYRHYFGVITGVDPLYESISEGRAMAGVEHWQPLFFDTMARVLDYAPGAPVTLDPQVLQALQEREAQILDFYNARVALDESRARNQKSKKSQDARSDVSLSGTTYHPLPPTLLYDTYDNVISSLSARDVTQCESFAGEEAGKTARRIRDFADIRARPEVNLFSEVRDYLKSLSSPSRTVAIACYSNGSRDRLKMMCEQNHFSNFVVCDDAASLMRIPSGYIALIILHLEHGFIADDLAVMTEQDILGDRLARKSKKRKRADNFLREVSSLSIGDYVVHTDHGVGRFEGLETLKAAGLMHDCLKITYLGGDKLFVPVENMEVLSRYGNDEASVQLDKLGSTAWQARKARVKKDLMRMAEGLLAIAAERKIRSADVIDTPSGSYAEFVAKFPYQETDDQQRAIDDCLSDLASGHPMDRLVCGDVGFGKTEVALRAAYVAAFAGLQVAVIAPTTLLARQHAANFEQRFTGTGIRIAHLSRLVNARDIKLAKDGLRDGTIHIAIGTHSLLSDNVHFSNLGLVVVDEEQRFGVKQKEKMKGLKANVHVLTLTATPIPRTLQMALTGVRDMSIIATPPVDRLAIRTSILPFDPVIMRDAILREHYRGGQSFYVCPRIKDMTALEEQLQELVPEVKVITAHGQMTATELEDRMTAFYEGQYGILLATNIIESGLDIPAANTIIIHRADLFGLSQLYQIRGRVGRSKIRAYAYLTYDPATKLTDQAQRRLEVFETLDSLGAGFQLASHDLDIRGAGNLLGEEQSGHIREVGVELYQQMLEDAVMDAQQRNEQTRNDTAQWSPTINIGTSVLIPETYIADLTVRMGLYRRLADLQETEDIESFAAELIDRFGALPVEVENLLDIVTIKSLCRKAQVVQVDAGPKGAVLTFFQNTPRKPEALLAWAGRNPSTVKLRPDQKLGIVRAWESVKERVAGVKRLLDEIAAL
jgi:transcription-repair coupling factor (superfamily II helicase)